VLEAGVTIETGFYNLFRMLANQTGQLVNSNELSITLKIKHTTVTNYLWVLQKCFHIALVKPFYQNLRKELTKMPKVFLMDTGLRNAMVNNFEPLNSRTDEGELWENMFFRLLAEKMDWADINYWRTTDGNEVDFVLPNLLETPRAFEVKFDQALIKPNKYKKFTEAYLDMPLQFASIEPFNEDFFRTITFNGTIS